MPNQNEMEVKIKEIIVEKAVLDIKPEDLKLDTSLNDGDLSLDSVQALEVLVGLEEEFDFQFNDDEITPEIFSSVSSLIKYVDKQIKQSSVKKV